MPLFSHKQEPVVEEPPKHSSSLFSRHHEPVVEEPPKRSSTLFSRNRTPPPATTTSSSHSSGLLHRHEDKSITNARERVLSAEAAEKDADRALATARLRVKEARDHVKRLEQEAHEEARLAKIKMKQAGDLHKRGKLLGRHDHV